MQEFDPRVVSGHMGPRLALAAFGFLAAGLTWYSAIAHHIKFPVRPARVVATSTPTPPLAASVVTIPVKVKSGETLDAAVRRAGLTPGDARQVVSALGKAFDTADIKAGLAFNAVVLQPRDQHGAARLISLSMRSSPSTAITLSRTVDGALRLSQTAEAVRDETAVAQGALSGSLYQSAAAAGAPPTVTAEVIQLFAHRLDFSRDIHAGDRFRVVYGRRVTASGRLVQAGDLYYAEILAKGHLARFYRYQDRGASKADYVDENGKDIKGFLLRTPVYGARITSGFGMRRHPILGYTRMHQGIDFGVPAGTPVLAAGDGVVEQARWAGGYGRLIKLRHAGGWETAYGHLSRWAAKPGQRVRQGQVIAYSGSTGESTGPHVHFEVIENGVKVNPKSAKVPVGGALEGQALAAFHQQKSRMDALLVQAGPITARLASAELTAPPVLATARTLTR